ncbi:MAG: hypothetical protein WDO12_00045 [Pseudomonadota bacterium]
MRSAIRQTFLGALALLATVGAVAAPKAYVGNFRDSTVSVIDTGTNAVVATVPVATGPHGMAITADGRTVYVASDGTSLLNIIDTASDKVTGTIEIGKAPHGLALTPDGRLLLAAINGEDKVALVDTHTQVVVATLPVPKPHTVAVRPDGKFAYVSSQLAGNFALVVIDLKKRVIARSVPLEQQPRDIEFSHDGKALYFTLAGVDAVQVLDPVTDKVIAQVASGASPHIATFFHAAKFGTAVVQGPGELLLFDAKKNVPLRSIPVGNKPHWLASGDGKTVYVTNEGSNDVTVVDLATAQTKTIAVGNAPRKIVVQPEANEEY